MWQLPSVRVCCVFSPEVKQLGNCKESKVCAFPLSWQRRWNLPADCFVAPWWWWKMFTPDMQIRRETPPNTCFCSHKYTRTLALWSHQPLIHESPTFGDTPMGKRWKLSVNALQKVVFSEAWLKGEGDLSHHTLIWKIGALLLEEGLKVGAENEVVHYWHAACVTSSIRRDTAVHTEALRNKNTLAGSL